MDCSREDEALLKERAPYVYKRFLQFEEENNELGLTISFRDTDHAYESFRWGISESSNKKPESGLKRLLKRESPKELNIKKLEEDIGTHCCICGLNQMVSVRCYDERASSAIFERLCAFCYGKELYGYEKIIHYAKYNQWCKDHEMISKCPNIKIRLLNDTGGLFYDSLENLFYDNDDFYLSNKISNKEHVRYAGLYLGVRDKNKERVYEGDIVVGTINENAGTRQFWGMAFEKFSSTEESCRKAINHIWLEHGGNYFPSPLNVATSFEVVGNVIEGNEAEVTQPRLEMYYKGWNVK